MALQNLKIAFAAGQYQIAHSAGKCLEPLIAGNEIGLAINFDDGAFIAISGDHDQTFRCHPAGFFGRRRQAFGAQPVDRRLDIACSFL